MSLNRHKARQSNIYKSPKVYIGCIIFLFAIALIGAAMMKLTRSPQMEGAAFLWLPAAFQLIAGVWFGPYLGLLVGGLGAYGAGIIAYGGWGLVDIIINPIAGGFANSMLPGFLFRMNRIDPTFGMKPPNLKRAVLDILFLLSLIIIFAYVLKIIKIHFWAYLLPILLLLLAPYFLTNLKVKHKKKFVIAFFICVIISLISSLIGSFGSFVGGSNWENALIGTGLGWFLGDTGSCLLGLYLLAYFTDKARKIKISAI